MAVQCQYDKNRTAGRDELHADDGYSTTEHRPLTSTQFGYGCVNYLFGIGVALSGLALWLALEPRRSWFRVLASSVVALLCYFSHLAAFGFYALVIIGVE